MLNFDRLDILVLEPCMNNEGYSLERFRAAQREGKVDLEPDELDFLGRYKRIRTEMLRGHDLQEMPNPIVLSGHLLVDLLRSERREILFSAGKALDLERQRADTMAGQLDAAHDEATELNRQYDELAKNVERAIDEFDQFVRKINVRE